MVPWTHLSPHPERYFDRFSLFAGFTIMTDRPTDGPTDHAALSVATDRS